MTDTATKEQKRSELHAEAKDERSARTDAASRGARAGVNSKKEIAAVRRAAGLLEQAEERQTTAIRAAATAGASRQEIANAVGLSKTRVQQIIHGTNR